MEEIKCEQVGQIVGSGFTEMTGRIYSTDGLTPSIRTFSGGNTEVKIAEPIIYDDYNGRIRADQDCIGTLTTNCGNDALRNGVKIIEPIIVDEIYNSREPRVYSEHCPTIRAERQGLEVMEPRIATMRGRNPDNPSDRTAGSPTEQRLEIGSEETSNTLTTVQKDNLALEPTYRIRKLSPDECFRLQGVKQEDFERVAENQSTSSLYHLAGDSIVTTGLMAILGQLFGVDYNEKINNLVGELKDKNG